MEHDVITMAHGAGGQLSHALMEEVVLPALGNTLLNVLHDGAVLPLTGRTAFTTDSYVVQPHFFPGGSIGRLAVCGTVNDLAMTGAVPRWLSLAVILEEGFPIATLRRIVRDIRAAAEEAGVLIVTGDTKVVPRGKCDKIFINTSGIGKIVCEGVELKSLRTGAKILISGDVGRHGAVVLASREELDLQSELKSDCKALVGAVKALVEGGVKPLCMRDATRGGLSAVLNEWAKFSGLDILVREEDIKVSDEVTGVCELFGFEPYELANEGTFVLAVDEKDEARALEILRKFDANAASIGEILGAANGRVILQNAYGSKRFLEAPKGELLPRIC